MSAQFELFDPSQIPVKQLEERHARLKQIIWTQSKSRLIGRYLQYFIYVTKHGIYIDGFAGPQRRTNLEMWSARFALENKPRLLRDFYFFEKDQRSVQLLRELKDSQPLRTKKEPVRKIEIIPGDFNSELPRVLAANPIPDSKATFALLDQRTFECKWSSVAMLATHKKGGNKIELFYFFPEGWFNRSYAAVKNKQLLARKWWGEDSLDSLTQAFGLERGKIVCQKFKNEFAYNFVKPYPIYSAAHGGRILYFMIHCSDHPAATPLMVRAYNNALSAEKATQMDIEDYLGSPVAERLRKTTC